MQMDRRTFAILCHLLRNVPGLSSIEIVDVEEMVAMFLHVLVHDVKNCVIQREFERSDETVSRYFNLVNIPAADRPTIRTRKGEIAINALDMCDTKGDFVYVLVGWEGSATDSRILRDVLVRENGLQVPKGYYYLYDTGYPNAERFLAPYLPAIPLARVTWCWKCANKCK
ncbi:retrotransposon protein [Cucumis melo var. makuwa]|uniref:Retrotransposon protein n=1 Tax=Cucumis melo var. makuwa TaxID=1194695 RepID=A0A5D3CIN7_CUCMM|nr:retrotransposon protein [Cucumis melo var. makuwa]TYK11783.1 retrotransposon protein [Cucumis melo var. makuwa]